MTTIDPRALAERGGGDAHGDEHGHDPHLAHHWSSMGQQFEAAKLGMWLFLGTEFLLFGGLFCLYAVLRHNRPELFAYGSQFLDTRWGAINTVVLIASSLTMALAVSAAQLGKKRLLVALLMASFLGGATFMAIKWVEYHHKFHERLVWGTAFYETPEWAARNGPWSAPTGGDEGDGGEVGADGAVAIAPPDVDHGRAVYLATCMSCHGASGEGMPGQGKPLQGNAWVAGLDDAALLDFLKKGRPIADPANTTGMPMPPKGGNPLLKDPDLRDVMAFVRTIVGDGTAPPPAPATEGGEVAEAPPIDVALMLSRSSIPLAVTAPDGLTPDAVEGDPVYSTAIAELDAERAAERRAEQVFPHHSIDPDRPANAHLFFGIYFLMTGLHGIHVLAGMGVIGWLMMRAIRGDFGPGYFTPVDLGGLYWHVVDVIWIFLFPLLYLI